MRTVSNATLDGVERLLEWIAGQPPGGSVADRNRRRNAVKLLKKIQNSKK